MKQLGWRRALCLAPDKIVQNTAMNRRVESDEPEETKAIRRVSSERNEREQRPIRTLIENTVLLFPCRILENQMGPTIDRYSVQIAGTQ